LVNQSRYKPILGLNIIYGRGKPQFLEAFPAKTGSNPAAIPQFPKNKTLIINTNRKSAFYSSNSAKRGLLGKRI